MLDKWSEKNKWEEINEMNKITWAKKCIENTMKEGKHMKKSMKRGKRKQDIQ